MTETTTSNFLIDVIADVPDGEIRARFMSDYSTVDIYNVDGTIYGVQTFATRGKARDCQNKARGQEFHRSRVAFQHLGRDERKLRGRPCTVPLENS